MTLYLHSDRFSELITKITAVGGYTASLSSGDVATGYSYGIDDTVGGLWSIDSTGPRTIDKSIDETVMETYTIQVNTLLNLKFANSGSAYATEIQLLDLKNKDF